MVLIEPDFSEIVELSAGDYKAHIVDAVEKTSQKGSKYIKWKFEVFDCEDARLNGKPVWTNTMLSGPGAFRLKQLTQSVLGKGHNGSFSSEDLFGKSVWITLVDGIDQNGSPSGFPEVKAVRALN